MRGIILFFICTVFGTQASEFSDWQRKQAQSMTEDIEEILISYLEVIETEPKEELNLGAFVRLILGDFGNQDALLTQHKVPPLAYYIKKLNIHKSSALSYRFGHFAYTLGLKNIAKAIFESVVDENRREIDFALGVLAAYDEDDTLKALKYLDASDWFESSISALFLRYMNASDEQKQKYARKLKDTTIYRHLVCFNSDWFIPNILDQCKSFKTIESLLWKKTKQGGMQAQLHLYWLYAQGMITLTKPQVQYALLIDLALNKKMPEAQYHLGMELVFRNWFPTPLGFASKWDGVALVFRSYKKVKEEWLLGFPVDKLTDQERDELQNKEIKYNPHWVLGPLI